MHATTACSRASVFVEGNRLFDCQEYVDDAARVMAPLQAAGTRVEIEVRFLERLTDGAQARERGVLRSTMYGADGAQVGRGHANFEAVLRREPGGWRILTERRWRSSDPAADAAAFEGAHPRGAFEPFLPATTPPAAPGSG